MLAIVVPYFKLAYFEETLISLSNQTDKRFKVYIGNDASPEDPSELLEKYKGKFDFEYHFFEDNLGSHSLTKQWERSIALADDENWIMILGDDDVLAINAIEEFYIHLPEIQNKTNLVRFASRIILEESQKVLEKVTHPKWETTFNFFYRRYKGLTRSSLSEYIFSKQSYLKYKFRQYPLGWHSDDMAWIDFAENNLIYTINSSCVYVRISEINISGRRDNFLAKNQAELFFYKDLINEKLIFFKTFQKIELLITYEIAIKKIRKLTLKEWVFLLNNYLKIGQILPVLKFVRRFCKDFLFS